MKIKCERCGILITISDRDYKRNAYDHFKICPVCKRKMKEAEFTGKIGEYDQISDETEEPDEKTFNGSGIEGKKRKRR